MGEPVAPSPQNGRGGKKRKRTRRKNAAQKAGQRQQAANKAAVKTASSGTDNARNIHIDGLHRNGANKNKPRVIHDPLASDTLTQGDGGKHRASRTRDPRRSWIGRSAYAALDLGTNNCRLLIARAGGDDFTVVDAFSRVVRLGEGLTATGKMSEEAMDRAVEALSVCAEKLKRRNVTLARSVATEACRQALNGAQFIERVRKETGIVLDIIPPQEEARLAVMGCHALLEPGDGPALIFDIGGG